MTQRLPLWRVVAGTIGLLLLALSVRLAASFASGQHAGIGGYFVLAGAVIGVILVLSWGAVRRRSSAGWMVLLGGILGSWTPMLVSTGWAALDPENAIPISHVLMFWLVWAAGAVLSLSAPVGLWLLWLAMRPLFVSPQRAA